MKKALFLIAAIAMLPMNVAAAEDPAEVDAVVAEIKAANPDMRALCQQGRDGIVKASSAASVKLAMDGKIKGNPAAVGGEAGTKIGQGCRG